MTDANDPTPEDEFRDMLRDILSGKEGVDASKLAGAAGLPNDPASLARLMGQLQAAMNAGGDGINWGQATDQARSIAESGVQRVTAIQRAEVDQAFHVASLWLAEVTEISDLVQNPRLITRLEWIDATMPL